MSADLTIDLITALWLGFIGACVGSFLNVVAYRLPLGMSVVWKPSHCPRCNHPIRARDNVPVLGWLMLRGRCRDCGAPISPRYAIVEAIMGIVFFLLAYLELFSGGENLPNGPFTELTGALHVVWYPQWNIIGLYFYHCLLMCLLTVFVLFDLDKNLVPRRFIWFVVSVIGVSSVAFPFLYVERFVWSDSSRIPSFLDAISGAIFLAQFGFIIWAFVKIGVNRGGNEKLAADAIRYALTIAFAGLTAGGFLGIQAAILLLLGWSLGMVVTRLVNRILRIQKLSILPALWLSVFLVILFWQQLKDALPGFK